MRLAFGSDHAGYGLRGSLAQWAEEQGHAVTEFGAQGEEPYDYPDAADLVAEEILHGRADFGVLICGTGIGIGIRANRHSHIRAAECLTAEMAMLSREHNHANVICMGARLIDGDQAKTLLDAFLKTEESKEPRHVRRVEKMDRGVSNG